MLESYINEAWNKLKLFFFLWLILYFYLSVTHRSGIKLTGNQILTKLKQYVIIIRYSYNSLIWVLKKNTCKVFKQPALMTHSPDSQAQWRATQVSIPFSLIQDIQEYTRLYKTIQYYTRIYNELQDYTRIYKNIQGYTRL